MYIHFCQFYQILAKITNKLLLLLFLNSCSLVLAGVAQWIEHWPVNEMVAGSIPSQGTCLGCGPGPQWGAHERQPHIDVSLPHFLLSLIHISEPTRQPSSSRMPSSA